LGIGQRCGITRATADLCPWDEERNMGQDYEAQEAAEEADGIAQKLMKVLDRAFDKGADSQTGMIAIFRVAHTAGEALLAIYPDFEKFLRAHGVPWAATLAGQPHDREQREVTTDKTAELLHSYMTFRAGREGQVHELSVAYYRAALGKGIQGFFGVTFGPEGLEADTQQSLLFEEWKNRRVQ
jgi:hypothetical protein